MRSDQQMKHSMHPFKKKNGDMMKPLKGHRDILEREMKV